ncbi:MAG: carboxypeptidase-like regulatory domain-containing protein [Acidobacteriota bacterium]|nr:carboxypeptidase-like regulatory domain-containing protein [Acidobacteriota bacterium]
MKGRRAAAGIGLLLAGSQPAFALQTALGPREPAVHVSGTVSDETGGVMWAATVRVFADASDDPVRETTTDRNGRFSVEVPAGSYLLQISAPAFRTVDRPVHVVPDLEPLAVTLPLEALEESVDVVDRVGEFAVDALSSLTATTLSGDDLLGLPDDEEDLALYLMLLAGADSSDDFEDDVAGFIIDGFDEGRLPRPEEIAQIIIDPTPLRADGGGEGPRVEIITRPGTGRWQRAARFDFSDEALDATTPGERSKPARQTRNVALDLRGPVLPGRLAVDVEASTDRQQRAADSLRAVTPAGNVFDGVVRPRREHELELNADIEVASNRSLGVRFDYETRHTENSGVGGFTLAERGTNDARRDWSFQVSERRLGDAFVNDLRVRMRRRGSTATPVSEGVAIDVADAFNRGGGTRRNLDDDTRIQVEDRLRWQRRGWSFQAGFEGYYARNYSVSEDNYNGTFDFASLHDYCGATGFAGINCEPTRRLVEEALGRGVVPTYLNGRDETVAITGLPTTFTLASGNGELDITELGVESYVQADREFGERASLRLGLRYEATNYSVDHLRFDPTVNLQYRLFDDTIVSVGSRVRFRDFRDHVRLIRNDGSTYQKQLSISSPSFPDPFQGGGATIDERRTSLYRLDPDYQSPYSVNPQFNVTQQLAGGLRLSVSYRMSYGHRQQRIRNVNAPFPGTPLPPEILTLPRDVRRETVDRMRPFYPNVGNIYQIESTGRSVGRRLRVRLERRRALQVAGIGLSGSLNYSYRAGEDDDDFNNPYLPAWGLARLQHRVQSQLRVRLPLDAGLRHPWLQALARATYEGTAFNFNLRAWSGRPYSIRSGRDLNGDQSTRDRPPGVARNTETGPARINLDMTFTKEFRPRATDLARAGGAPGTERLVRFQARFYNVFNITNVRGYSGVLSSPLFGQPTGFLRGRTVRLSMHVDF